MKFNTATRFRQRNAALLLLSGVLSIPALAQSQPPAAKAVKAAAPKQAGKVVETPAAAAPVQAPAAVPEEAPKAFAPVFFDPAVPVLQYASNDPKKVYDWVVDQMASTPGKPDKFSSPEERSAYDAALAARMGGIGPIPFIGRCLTKYDPALEVYEAKGHAGSIKASIDGFSMKPEAMNLRRVFLARMNDKVDSYEAGNAYGAVTKVFRKSSDTYAVVLQSGPGNEPSSSIEQGNSPGYGGYLYSFYYYKQTFKMPRDQARSVDKDIGCLYVASLAAPWVVTYKEQRYPTRSEPFDETESYFGFYGKLDMIAVINKASGEMYSKVERTR